MWALMTLSPEQLAVLILVDLAECSCSEAAELLDIPLGTVKSRLLAARTNMQRALGPKEQYLGAVPLAFFRRRALVRRLVDYVYPFGHLLLASLFFALYRPLPPEAPAVATGATHVIGASAAGVAKAAEVSGSATAPTPSPLSSPPLSSPPLSSPPLSSPPLSSPPLTTPAQRTAPSPDPFVVKPSSRRHSPVGGKGWSW
ncbi:RNA polymerase sigma factor [Polyangium fumosum]|uniref:RNA polymerase sigma factor n=1 Tax=Polyangium fumosum TaxID=889272 RepID=UPI0022B65C8F|nr:sigma factor-like helix-turn-helix DNA-binding protein [Polyangium fumosum]